MPTNRSTRPRSDPRPLSEVARHVKVPAGIVTTGWPAVGAKLADLGVVFDGWQVGAGQLVLAKRADGLYAHTVGGVVLSLPRQTGKTFLLGALLFALCLLTPGLTVIWTAHRLRTAAETFAAMQGFAQRARVAPSVTRVLTGAGSEAVEFTNGSRILFGARERGFGRGFAEVDVLVFDEAQILTESALDDMVPAANAAPNALLVFAGTPPRPQDPSAVFEAKRRDALDGDADTLYIECSAEVGADPGDRGQWRRANPSYPHRTPAASMLRMRKNLGAESFVREALGVWDETSAADRLDAERWRTLADPATGLGDYLSFGVAVSRDRSRASIGVAWRRADGAAQVMVSQTERGALDYRPGTHWLAARVDELVGRWGGSVLADARAEGTLPPDAAATTNQRDRARAEALLSDALDASELRHGNQDCLNVAVRGARWRRAGELRVLDDATDTDVTPLRAVALALAGLDGEETESSGGWVLSL